MKVFTNDHALSLTYQMVADSYRSYLASRYSPSVYARSLFGLRIYYHQWFARKCIPVEFREVICCASQGQANAPVSRQSENYLPMHLQPDLAYFPCVVADVTLPSYQSYLSRKVAVKLRHFTLFWRKHRSQGLAIAWRAWLPGYSLPAWRLGQATLAVNTCFVGGARVVCVAEQVCAWSKDYDA